MSNFVEKDGLHFLRSTPTNTEFIVLGFLYCTCFQYLITQQHHGLFSRRCVYYCFGWCSFTLSVKDRLSHRDRCCWTTTGWYAALSCWGGRSRRGWAGKHGGRLVYLHINAFSLSLIINQGMQLKGFSSYNSMLPYVNKNKN